MSPFCVTLSRLLIPLQNKIPLPHFWRTFASSYEECHNVDIPLLTMSLSKPTWLEWYHLKEILLDNIAVYASCSSAISAWKYWRVGRIEKAVVFGRSDVFKDRNHWESKCFWCNQPGNHISWHQLGSFNRFYMLHIFLPVWFIGYGTSTSSMYRCFPLLTTIPVEVPHILPYAEYMHSYAARE